MIASRRSSLRRRALRPALSNRLNSASTSWWSCFSSVSASTRPPLLRPGPPRPELSRRFAGRVVLAVRFAVLTVRLAALVVRFAVLAVRFVVRLAVRFALLVAFFAVERPDFLAV